MKDKSRFVSSVIVSLLAGFIYYQFGDNIQEKFQNTVKAVISSNDLELSAPSDCESFSTLVSNSKAKLKKKKIFVKKRNTVEFKTKGESISGDEMFSEFISKAAAKINKPVADKTPDFTAELQSLINGTAPKNPGRQNRISRSDVSTDEVTELNSMKSELKKIDKNLKISPKSFHKNNTAYGNGFEYNYMKNESSGKNYNSNETQSSEPGQTADECTSYKKVYQKYSKYGKVKVKIPPVKNTQNEGAPECSSDDM